MPPRTDLNPKVTKESDFEGYRLLTISYESRPGIFVPAHLYLPLGEGPFPVVLSGHGHWPAKKSEPTVQACGISLALNGIACFIVEAPGFSWDWNDQNERRSMGTHDDWFASMGAPLQGVYVWDLMRGLDYLESRKDIDTARVGMTGASGGGTVANFLFAADPRVTCVVPICAAGSFMVQPHNGCLCNHVPGVLSLGDRSDMLSISAPNPIMLICASDDKEWPPEAHRATFERLRKAHSAYRSDANLRLEIVEGGHDLNRRMREAMLAFFCQHLKDEPQRGFKAEPRPLTDGYLNPYPSNTLEVTDNRLAVFEAQAPESTTLRALSERALMEPYPQPYSVSDRVIRWGRYMNLHREKVGDRIEIVDEGNARADSFILPIVDLDRRIAIYLGISVPEIFAQLLHLTLPGVPEGWERTGLAGDAMTAMIASVRTLVSKAEPETPVSHVKATGPVSSVTAMFLRLYRPEIEIEVSHAFSSWLEVFQSNDPNLVQPGARYLEWPFGG